MATKLTHLNYTLPELHGKDAQQLDLAGLTYHEFFERHEECRLVIPVFQRRYCWTERIVSRWFFDVTTAGTSAEPHRTGRAFFLKPSSEELVVIDGQQRLTTLFLFFAAVRARAASLQETPETPALLSLLDSYLYLGDEPRLTPSYPDRLPFARLLAGAALPCEQSALTTAYAVFEDHVDALSVHDLGVCVRSALHHTALMQLLYTRLERPSQVFLYLQEKSLFSMGALLWNPTPGLKFHACDLVRNLVCAVWIDSGNTEEMYRKWWLPLEEHAGGLDEFDEGLAAFVAQEEKRMGRSARRSEFTRKLEEFRAYAPPNMPPMSAGVECYSKFVDLHDERVRAPEDVNALLSDLNQFLIGNQKNK